MIDRLDDYNWGEVPNDCDFGLEHFTASAIAEHIHHSRGGELFDISSGGQDSLTVRLRLDEKSPEVVFKACAEIDIHISANPCDTGIKP